MHRVTIRDDPAGYPRARGKTLGPEHFGVAPGDVRRFNISRVCPNTIEHAGCVADYVFQPRGEDRKRVAQIEARANRLCDVIERDHFSMRASYVLVDHWPAFGFGGRGVTRILRQLNS